MSRRNQLILVMTLVAALGKTPLPTAVAGSKEGLWITNSAAPVSGGPFTSEFQGRKLKLKGSRHPAADFAYYFGNVGLYGGVGAPQGIAFDSSGWLWTAYCAAVYQGVGTVVGTSPEQLHRAARHKKLTQQIVISESNGYFDCPKALAFDTTGNLWVANSGSELGSPSLIEIRADDL
jgi:hypothetical protein